MPRIARVIAVQYPHHITQRGNNRADVFFDDEDREYYKKTLKGYCQKKGVTIWAYCLMSNHVHILTVPSGEESLARSIGRTNLVYTQYINRKYKRSGRLWQNRFFSTIVEQDPYLWTVARYIESNPVRVGLVRNPEQYQWSSCKAHIGGTGDDLITDDEWLDESNRNAYKDFLAQEDPMTEQKIRRATSTGRPIGSDGFIRRLEKCLSRSLIPKKAGPPKKGKSKN